MRYFVNVQQHSYSNKPTNAAHDENSTTGPSSASNFNMSGPPAARQRTGVDTCPICCDQITNPRQLPCCRRAIFCSDCIAEWQPEKQRRAKPFSCPLCRAECPSDVAIPFPASLLRKLVGIKFSDLHKTIARLLTGIGQRVAPHDRETAMAPFLYYDCRNFLTGYRPQGNYDISLGSAYAVREHAFFLWVSHGYPRNESVYHLVCTQWLRPGQHLSDLQEIEWRPTGLQDVFEEMFGRKVIGADLTLFLQGLRESGHRAEWFDTEITPAQIGPLGQWLAEVFFRIEVPKHERALQGYREIVHFEFS
ncbi:hypothetical protein BT63DRAFT_211185 [Microthyrium microscopicum]|uniref:RING-type domain-containing protein n=1 Tax=Microthyrium microscopicum TaxID=703497 RepID=A0A6A6UG41_9PEZI|nr:hypothetical protein BT63DRAFT_211185 [Microthyrium microscopicum]